MKGNKGKIRVIKNLKLSFNSNNNFKTNKKSDFIILFLNP